MLSGKEKVLLTGGHYKKLINPWYRFCRLVFALTPVYDVLLKIRVPNTTAIARGKPK